MDRIALLRSFLEADPSDTFSAFALALELHKTGELTEAIATFERLRRASPSYTGLYYHLARFYKEAGNQEQGLRIIDEGISVCKAAASSEGRKDLAELYTLRDSLLHDDED